MILKTKRYQPERKQKDKGKPPRTIKQPQTGGSFETESGSDGPVVIDLSDEEEDMALCSICYEVVDAGETVFAMSCRHVQHFDCMKLWVVRKPECPECRQTLPLPTVEEITLRVQAHAHAQGNGVRPPTMAMQMPLPPGTPSLVVAADGVALTATQVRAAARRERIAENRQERLAFIQNGRFDISQDPRHPIDPFDLQPEPMSEGEPEDYDEEHDEEYDEASTRALRDEDFGGVLATALRHGRSSNPSPTPVEADPPAAFLGTPDGLALQLTAFSVGVDARTLSPAPPPRAYDGGEVTRNPLTVTPPASPGKYRGTAAHLNLQGCCMKERLRVVAGGPVGFAAQAGTANARPLSPLRDLYPPAIDLQLEPEPEPEMEMRATGMAALAGTGSARPLSRRPLSPRPLSPSTARQWLGVDLQSEPEPEPDPEPVRQCVPPTT